jgi:hypothetical protein
MAGFTLFRYPTVTHPLLTVLLNNVNGKKQVFLMRRIFGLNDGR